MFLNMIRPVVGVQTVGTFECLVYSIYGDFLSIYKLGSNQLAMITRFMGLDSIWVLFKVTGIITFRNRTFNNIRHGTSLIKQSPRRFGVVGQIKEGLKAF